MVPATESIWMPRKVKAVAAETVLWSARENRGLHMSYGRCEVPVSSLGALGDNDEEVVEVVVEARGSVAHDSPRDCFGHR